MTEAGAIEFQHDRPRRHLIAPCPVDRPCRPGRPLACRILQFCSVKARDRLALSVPAHPVHRLWSAGQQLKRRPHERTGCGVTTDDDHVNVLGVDVVESGAESRPVPMDVRDDSDLHPWQAIRDPIVVTASRRNHASRDT